VDGPAPAAAGVWVADCGRSTTLELGEAVGRDGSAGPDVGWDAGWDDVVDVSPGLLLGAGLAVDVGVVGLVSNVVAVVVVVVGVVVVVVVGAGVRRCTSVRGAQV
jgi:hypothetical protein